MANDQNQNNDDPKEPIKRFPPFLGGRPCFPEPGPAPLAPAPKPGSGS